MEKFICERRINGKYLFVESIAKPGERGDRYSYTDKSDKALRVSESEACRFQRYMLQCATVGYVYPVTVDGAIRLHPTESGRSAKPSTFLWEWVDHSSKPKPDPRMDRPRAAKLLREWRADPHLTLTVERSPSQRRYVVRGMSTAAMILKLED